MKGGVARVGDRVRHYGTREWAVVQEVKPQHDGTDELLVQRVLPENRDAEAPRWWASYAVDLHEAKC